MFFASRKQAAASTVHRMLFNRKETSTELYKVTHAEAKMSGNIDVDFLREHELEIKRHTTWRWAEDVSTAKLYYYDTKTRKTSWLPPKEFLEALSEVRNILNDAIPPPPPLHEENGVGTTRYIHPCQDGSSYSTISSEEEFDQYSQLLGDAFAISKEDAGDWLRRMDREWYRVLKNQNRRVVSGVTGAPMGIYTNGEAVPCVGVTGVGVAFDARGYGYGGNLMKKYMAEIGDPVQSAKTPLACLYPTAPEFYRKLGFEIAGGLWEAEIEMSAITEALATFERPIDVVVRPLNAEIEMPLLQQLHESYVSKYNGCLDRSRSDLLWGNVRSFKGKTNQGLVVEVINPEDSDSPVLEGYIFVRQSRPDSSKFEITITVQDMLCTTERSAVALLYFLASHRSMVNRVAMRVAPFHPWSLLLSNFAPTLYCEYMVRVLHVMDALRMRRYPTHVTGSICLRVKDTLLSHNHGMFLLDIVKGHALRCENVSEYGEAPAPVISLDVAALACLYTGYLTAHQLSQVGKVVGEPAALDAATLIFGTNPGGPPWTSDMF